jgi:hypothetical protein
MNRDTLMLHPFRKGVMLILDRHFAPNLAKRFSLNMEAFVYDKYADKSIYAQLKSDNHIMEVYYHNPDGTREFICDLQQNMRPQQCEVFLLRHITDKVKVGAIGRDWAEQGGRLAISKDILESKYETQIN